MPNVYIILVNWNGLNDTLECIASLKNLDFTNYKIVVVDNGSLEDPTNALDADVIILKTYQNLGFAEGNNVGIRYALAKGADAIWLLNNDTVVKPDALSAFVNQMDQSSIMGSKLMCYHERDHFDHLGGLWNSQRGYFDLIAVGEKDTGQYDKPLSIDYVCGASLFAKRQVFEAVGMLEPRFFLYWEESDWCWRAKKKGFTTMTCPQSTVYHKGSASMVGGKPFQTYYDWRGRLLWIKRHCSKKEKLRLYKKVIAPEILKLYRHRWLKKLQSFLGKSKHTALPRLEAAIAGIKDHTYGRGGYRDI